MLGRCGLYAGGWIVGSTRDPARSTNASPQAPQICGVGAADAGAKQLGQENGPTGVAGGIPPSLPPSGPAYWPEPAALPDPLPAGSGAIAGTSDSAVCVAGAGATVTGLQ